MLFWWRVSSPRVVVCVGFIHWGFPTFGEHRKLSLSVFKWVLPFMEKGLTWFGWLNNQLTEQWAVEQNPQGLLLKDGLHNENPSHHVSYLGIISNMSAWQRHVSELSWEFIIFCMSEEIQHILTESHNSWFHDIIDIIAALKISFPCFWMDRSHWVEFSVVWLWTFFVPIFIFPICCPIFMVCISPSEFLLLFIFLIPHLYPSCCKPLHLVL